MIADRLNRFSYRQADSLRKPVAALVQVLNQLSGLLASGVADAEYAANPVGVFPSSIGSHVRHCLDHVEALLAGAVCGHIDYDQRERGTQIERCRSAAIEAIEGMKRRLYRFEDAAIDRPLTVSIMLSGSDPPVEYASGLGRELAYVLSHTIHHNAIIGAMAKTLGRPVPDRFGYAPSTLAYLARTSMDSTEARACVR